MKRAASLLLFPVALLVPLRDAGASEVLYEKQSQYHYISVFESGNVRTLTFRRKGFDRNQSRMDISDPLRPCLPYYPLMFAGYLFVPEPRRILIVGLGAGVLSQWSAHYFPDATVDSIELDPEVVEVARKFFAFEEGEKQRVFIRDARVQIKVFRDQRTKYNVIMLDAFRGGYVPPHLATTEFFEECRDILSPEGDLVVNLKPGWIIYQFQRRTLATVFPDHYPFGGASGSEVIVALPSKKGISKESLLAAANQLQEKRKFAFRVADVVSEFDTGPGFAAIGDIFTDNHVPANILRQQMENPHGIHTPPGAAFARVAAWLKAHRLPIISVSLILIIATFVLRVTRRSRPAEDSKPGGSESGQT
jgi:spermidine synthase